MNHTDKTARKAERAVALERTIRVYHEARAKLIVELEDAKDKCEALRAMIHELDFRHIVAIEAEATNGLAERTELDDKVEAYLVDKLGAMKGNK